MDADQRSDITLLLAEVRAGHADSHEKLVQAIYAELRREAGRRMYRERPDHTLQPSDLVHEAVIRLREVGVLANAPNSRFLFAAAAEAMRRILVDHARHHRTLKCNGNRVRVSWMRSLVAIEDQGLDVIALHEALDRLAQERPGQQIVTLRFFGGLSVPEVAESLGISKRTVEYDWTFARPGSGGQLGRPRNDDSPKRRPAIWPSSRGEQRALRPGRACAHCWPACAQSRPLIWLRRPMLKRRSGRRQERKRAQEEIPPYPLEVPSLSEACRGGPPPPSTWRRPTPAAVRKRLPKLPRRPIAEGPGTRIGPYKLLQKIGEGGMGVVYMAEQEEPVRRSVALKIIKPGMDTEQVIARFEAERQALALMDHPNIAKVLDAGDHRHRPALLRHGAGQGRADHRVLRPQSTDAPRAAGAVRAGLPGDPARRTRRGSSTATSSRRTSW